MQVAVADSVFPTLDRAGEVLAAIGARLELAAAPTPEMIQRVAAGANALLVTYTSFYSEESLVELQTKAAQEVVAVLTGQMPRNPVNPEVLQRL